jgi:hypothetical protein
VLTLDSYPHPRLAIVSVSTPKESPPRRPSPTLTAASGTPADRPGDVKHMDGCVRLLNRCSPTANWMLARIEPDAVYADHRYSHRPLWPAG